MERVVTLNLKTGYPRVIWKRRWVAGRGYSGKYQLVWLSYNSTRVRKVLRNYDANNKAMALQDKAIIEAGIGFGQYRVVSS